MKYPGIKLQKQAGPGIGEISDANPMVENVIIEFAKIRVCADYLSARDSDFFDPPHKYTRKNHGDNRARCHFQGIQRLKDGNYLVISGGDPVDNLAQLFILNIESPISQSQPQNPQLLSELRKGSFGSNVILSCEAPKEDKLVAGFLLRDDDGNYPLGWHPGGLSIMGDILVIPIEDKEDLSQVIFLNMKNPLTPRLIETRIRRSEENPDKKLGNKAGAVACCKLPNQRYICAVWSDSDKKPTRLDFYMSQPLNNPQIFTDVFRFPDKPVSWPFSKLWPTGGRNSKYQSINFVVQKDDKLYLIGTENTSCLAPFGEGDDYADLLLVEFPEATLRMNNPVLAEPTIIRLAEKKLIGGDDWYNMSAAAGVYIGTSGSLNLYSTFHWRQSKEFRFAEFRADVPSTNPQVENIHNAWIELFEHKNFQGRRLSILGMRNQRIKNYKKIFVQGKQFCDKVSSARYQIPIGHTYRLFRDNGFKPKKKGFPTNLDLVGTGKVEEIEDFELVKDPNGDGFGEMVSSSRYLEDTDLT